jgi:RNA polymerase sigma factor (sigma-70 family)
MSEERKKVPAELGQARERFLELVTEVRPELHRYCSRVVGSAVDGEDVVQEALAKAFYAISMATELPPLRPWLFRIAHNTAIDSLRRYERRHVEPRGDFEETVAADEALDPEVLRATLASFLDLPVLQRCAVILKDVLDHSLEETADTMGTTVPSVKAALVRGRATLRNGRARPAARAVAPAPIDPAERRRLQHYVALFNARNWDALGGLMAEEVRLDLVSRAALRGKEVRGYFGRYAAMPELRLALGTIEGRAALFVLGAGDDRPAYFIFLEWKGEQVSLIRDFRYAPYVAREIEIERDAAAAAPPPPARS